MALYSMKLVHKCPRCDRPATVGIFRSGTDQRGSACPRHVGVVGRALAARIGEEWVG